MINSKYFPESIVVGLVLICLVFGACEKSNNPTPVYQDIGKADTIQIIGADWNGSAIVVIDTLHKNICYFHSEGVSCLPLR